jgi:hypothetical protein
LGSWIKTVTRMNKQKTCQFGKSDVIAVLRAAL